MSEVVVRHFMGDSPCPDCKKQFDPVSGYCSECEGDLRLWRVTSLPGGWFDGEGRPQGALDAVVSTRTVPKQVAAFLGDETRILFIQPVEG